MKSTKVKNPLHVILSMTIYSNNILVYNYNKSIQGITGFQKPQCIQDYLRNHIITCSDQGMLVYVSVSVELALFVKANMEAHYIWD